MDEYRRLERVAAYKKATDTFVHLNEQKESGDLSVDQEAQLAAATSFLTEEAWIDDQGEYVFNMLKSLQKGDLKKDPEEQKKWQSMARMLAKVGWVKDKQETDASGKIVTKKAFATAEILTADAVLPDTYDRNQAADLQNLAITGLDTELVAVNKKVYEKKDQNIANKEKAEEIARKTAINEIASDATHQDEFTRADQLAEREVQAEIQERQKAAAELARKKARATLKDRRDLTKQQKDQMVEEEAERAKQAVAAPADVEAMRREAKERAKLETAERMDKGKIDKAVQDAGKGFETDYWKVAESVLPTLQTQTDMFGQRITTMDTVDDLKNRYDKHADIMQYATRTFKKNALETGHEELGMNQDFDDSKDVYRFQTYAEGKAKVHADRVKIDRRKLAASDQFHTNGRLNFPRGKIGRAHISTP